MYLQKLKQQILYKKFQKKLSEESISRITSKKVIQSVAILTSEKMASKIDLQQEVEQILNVRNCKIFKFRDYNKLDENSFHHFTEKDINWKGDFTNVNLQSFLDQPFDLLISFFDEKSLFLEFATLSSKATFKTGFANVNQSLFDLEIVEKTENCKSFLSELKNYLIILKKLEN